MELTKEQIDRQDFVDNSIFNLIAELNPTEDEIEWDIEMIGEIRDLISDLLNNKLSAFNQKDFYPYIED